ncbi:hypothetical protein EVAR_67282_1 [Eumeta japonica]|uniref:Uncharacterized protein n=1 Tax=Eumeta variegata TaxID=151549 RepID=A0A4C1ZX15_EUMVA|nr:hypothetical protein EVAR_67282_1 [Eumeta japonica]
MECSEMVTNRKLAPRLIGLKSIARSGSKEIPTLHSETELILRPSGETWTKLPRLNPRRPHTLKILMKCEKRILLMSPLRDTTSLCARDGERSSRMCTSNTQCARPSTVQPKSFIMDRGPIREDKPLM